MSQQPEAGFIRTAIESENKSRLSPFRRLHFERRYDIMKPVENRRQPAAFGRPVDTPRAAQMTRPARMSRLSFRRFFSIMRSLLSYFTIQKGIRQ